MMHLCRYPNCTCLFNNEAATLVYPKFQSDIDEQFFDIAHMDIVYDNTIAPGGLNLRQLLWI